MDKFYHRPSTQEDFERENFIVQMQRENTELKQFPLYIAQMEAELQKLEAAVFELENEKKFVEMDANAKIDENQRKIISLKQSGENLRKTSEDPKQLERELKQVLDQQAQVRLDIEFANDEIS